MRGFALSLMAIGVLMWAVAFYFGPDSGLYEIGTYGIVVIGAGIFFYIIRYLAPRSKPKVRHKRTKGPMRKCRICGRPAIPDSDLCRYHADEQKALKGEDNY